MGELSGLRLSSNKEVINTEDASKFRLWRQSITKRRMDFGEFVYLCTTNPQKDCVTWHVMRKEIYRNIKILLDVDLYRVPVRVKKWPWPPEDMEDMHPPSSVYLTTGGLTEKSRETVGCRSRSKRASLIGVRPSQDDDDDNIAGEDGSDDD